MLKNYFKIAMRNITKHKGYAFINIIGLAVGMACCILILLWVQDELSFDRFHKNADRLYRIVLGDSNRGPDKRAAVTPIPLAPTLKKEIPEVIYAAQLAPRRTLLQVDEKRFDEDGLMVNPDFLKMFSFRLIRGNVETALSDPSSIVITQSLAEKYFGQKDPMGHVFRENNTTDWTVTGVIEDVPSQSHLRFDFLMSFDHLERMGVDLNDWENISYYAYVSLKEKSDIRAVQEKINACAKNHLPDIELFYALQPLKQIYLQPPFLFDMAQHGNRESVMLFTIVALFVLLIGCMNFMNLSTARSGRRAMEVGLRKVAGARRTELTRQFFTESLSMVQLALLLAVVLVALVLPAFNTLTGKTLTLRIWESTTLLLGFLGIAAMTGLVSGSYPALYLSALRPAAVLKQTTSSRSKGALFRRILVVVQFSLTIMVLVGMTLVHKQFHYLQNKDLGYDKTHILFIPMKGDMQRQTETVKQALLTNPDVVSAAATANLPTHLQSGIGGVEWEGKSLEEDIHFKILWVDPDYQEVFRLTMAQGRFFSKDVPTDRSGFVLNETAVKAMEIDSPIGKRMSGRGQEGTILGVVKDFHFRSLHHPIEPLMMIFRPERLYTLCIRTRPNANVQRLVGQLESLWNRFSPEFPFEFHFLDQRIESLYKSERRTRDLFNYFSLLAIGIACLGLFGLASFTAEQRTKEIGVRKILGASVPGIIFLLTKEFIRWVIWANVIAWPVAYYVMNNWLHGYSYRISINIWSFILSGTLAIVIAVMTVSYQSLRAALADPVKSLRYE